MSLSGVRNFRFSDILRGVKREHWEKRENFVNLVTLDEVNFFDCIWNLDQTQNYRYWNNRSTRLCYWMVDMRIIFLVLKSSACLNAIFLKMTSPFCLKFIPSIKHCDKALIKEVLETYGKKRRLMWYYCNEGQKFISWRNVESPLIKIIKSLSRIVKNKRDIREKIFDYFLVNNPQLGRFCLLFKIHKKLFNVPARPVIFDSGYYTDNSSAFPKYYQYNLIAQTVKSYIKDTNYFFCFFLSQKILTCSR